MQKEEKDRKQVAFDLVAFRGIIPLLMRWHIGGFAK